MNSNKVDILLATYNGKKYIKEQLESILNQTYKDIRVLINDDASTDGTIDILKEYEEKDSRIQVQYNEKNLGFLKNFENLLTRVENKYYMLSDQDDYWMPEKVEKSLNKIITEDADMVFTDLEAVNEKLETITPSVVRYMGFIKNIKKYNDYRLVFLRNCVTGCTIISKSEYIKDIIPIPENGQVIHDWWMTLMVAQKGKIVYLDEPTIKYRQHSDNQIGIYGMKNRINSAEEYRKEYINLKLNQFKLYVKNKERFSNKCIPELANKAIDYFETIKDKKYINFKKYKTFFEIYNIEYPMMRLKTFIMLNVPIIAKITYKIFK